MAVLVVIEVPGGSSELDDVLTEAWHVDGDPPVGNVLRLAGPMDGGWRVISLWDSREQFQAFLDRRLRLTVGDADDGIPTVTYWEIEKVHRFD